MSCLENKWCWFVDGDEHFKVCESESEAHGEAKSHIDDNYEKAILSLTRSAKLVIR